jgi:hypothetical protein
MWWVWGSSLCLSGQRNCGCSWAGTRPSRIARVHTITPSSFTLQPRGLFDCSEDEVMVVSVDTGRTASM